jgi:hypothetical protein
MMERNENGEAFFGVQGRMLLGMGVLEETFRIMGFTVFYGEACLVAGF